MVYTASNFISLDRGAADMSSPDKRQETVRVKGKAAEGSTGSLTG